MTIPKVLVKLIARVPSFPAQSYSVVMSKPVGPYTPAVKAGDWLVVSGQIGIVDGALVAGGFEAQLSQALDNLRSLLKSNDATLSQVVKTVVFLTDMEDYDAMNEIYIAAFGEHRPARSAVAASGLPLGAVVEIEAWVYLGSD